MTSSQNQPTEFGNTQPTIFPLPVVERGLSNAPLATYLLDMGPRLHLFDRKYDLRF